ncbi:MULTISPECIES: fimbrial protein [Enterobacteriaceae]|uniref:Fimbrial protein n=1 Tax=Raoultella lignicola TaxID=3040939 RepID=A0ABU9FE55_9ENTR|nr:MULTISPECIES: fimbrial protein [Enterobacteriaceae]MRT48058.1 fimbrial protein [Raoultella sp. RIT712]QNK05871.1 type 1 fimbrial protein [Enterobacter sp. JUb54]ROS13389.1 major type 1 subunit fimbrin (pilin)/type 1 fimbrial protein [Raoultella sp. BIGb0399]
MKLYQFGKIALVLAAAGLSSVANAADGTINFIGTISAAACSVNNTAGTSSTSGTVDFGQVSNITLATAGASTVSTPFSIELTECAVENAPKITFTGTSLGSSARPELFASGITGVGIRIEDAGASGTYYTTDVSNSNTGLSLLGEDVVSATGKFNAYLVSDTATAKTGGDIDTNVTFTIDYS